MATLYVQSSCIYHLISLRLTWHSNKAICSYDFFFPKSRNPPKIEVAMVPDVVLFESVEATGRYTARTGDHHRDEGLL